MSGLPGQVDNDGGGGQDKGDRDPQVESQLELPEEVGGPSVQPELTPVNMPLHMTDAEVVKHRLLEKGLAKFDETRPVVGVAREGSRRRSRKLSIGGVRMDYDVEEKKEDSSVGRNSSDNSEKDPKKVEERSPLPSGVIRTVGSARRLTKNQSTRLAKFGTVLPVSGKEAKEMMRKSLTKPKNGVGGVTIKEGEEMDMQEEESMDGQSVASSQSPMSPDRSSKLLTLNSFKSQRSFGATKKQRNQTVIGKTFSFAARRVTNIVGLLGKKGNNHAGERRESALRKAQEDAWEKLLNDHLENSVPQLRRYLRWKEDYAYFMKRKEGKFDERVLSPILMKRGKCLCPLSKQSCGPMDPYEYTVHCVRCKEELPPFSDQMVAMSNAIGEPDNVIAHRNAFGLEQEEERDMLAAQEVYIEALEDDRMSIAEGRSVMHARKLHTHRHGADSGRRSVRRSTQERKSVAATKGA
ncbi:hypothetical protein TrRE_jg4813 [Triparma retinervis]|uniref:Uncharacterized protein n=1 Tax=Triparma retinervis TaxID=2557542 RepID=A0A9W7CJ30_9STRA|nr:hypothetical protein TrRE_jg4813 [Triparma retinervis]